MARKQTKARKGKKVNRRTRRNGRKMRGSGFFGNSPRVLNNNDFQKDFSATRKKAGVSIYKLDFKAGTVDIPSELKFDFNVGTGFIKQTALFVKQKSDSTTDPKSNILNLVTEINSKKDETDEVIIEYMGTAISLDEFLQKFQNDEFKVNNAMTLKIKLTGNNIVGNINNYLVNTGAEFIV